MKKLQVTIVQIMVATAFAAVGVQVYLNGLPKLEIERHRMPGMPGISSGPWGNRAIIAGPTDREVIEAYRF